MWGSHVGTKLSYARVDTYVLPGALPARVGAGRREFRQGWRWTMDAHAAALPQEKCWLQWQVRQVCLARGPVWIEQEVQETAPPLRGASSCPGCSRRAVSWLLSCSSSVLTTFASKQAADSCRLLSAAPPVGPAARAGVGGSSFSLPLASTLFSCATQRSSGVVCGPFP